MAQIDSGAASAPSIAAARFGYRQPCFRNKLTRILARVFVRPVKWMSTREPLLDSTGSMLIRAAQRTYVAATACRDWERGADAEPVSVTAAMARDAAEIAIEAVVADEPLGDPLDDPQSRRSRLAYAAWLLLLAGADEDGESSELTLAAHLFGRASRA
jgi:hypothetical protein